MTEFFLHFPLFYVSDPNHFECMTRKYIDVQENTYLSNQQPQCSFLVVPAKESY